MFIQSHFLLLLFGAIVWDEPGLSIFGTNFLVVFVVSYDDKNILSFWVTKIFHLGSHNGGIFNLGPSPIEIIYNFFSPNVPFYIINTTRFEI